MQEPAAPQQQNKRRVPWVVITLALANIGVFAWEISAGASVTSPTAQWMLEHGGNFGPLTLDGQQWRLFTSMFLHFGVMHLVMNMIGLIDGGRHVERMYGHAGFIALYLVSGLAGSLATSLRAHAVSAGASGAIFGVFGAFGAFLLVHRDRLDREEVTKQSRGLLIFLVYNIWFGATADGIDLVAHLGGLAAGFGIGIALAVGTGPQRSTLRRSLLVAVLGTVLVAGLSFVLPRPTNAAMALGQTEEKVLGRWNALVPKIQAGEISDDELADIIENEILPPWRDAHAAYERDGDGSVRADMLLYLEARQEGWELMLKGLRAQDQELVQRGAARFAEGDVVIKRIGEKNGK